MAGQYLMPHKYHLALHFWWWKSEAWSVVRNRADLCMATLVETQWYQLPWTAGLWLACVFDHTKCQAHQVVEMESDPLDKEINLMHVSSPSDLVWSNVWACTKRLWGPWQFTKVRWIGKTVCQHVLWMHQIKRHGGRIQCCQWSTCEDLDNRNWWTHDGKHGVPGQAARGLCIRQKDVWWGPLNKIQHWLV